MKKFYLCLFGGIFFVLLNLNAQTPPNNKHFGTARLDSLRQIEKNLKIDIDSCQVQLSRNVENEDIAKRLKGSQARLESIQKQMQYIKQIKGKPVQKANL